MSDGLNPPQRDAVRYLDGPCLVLAGAGSGKTRVIAHKIAYLVGECGFTPASVAAITFTNKAAREMQQRVAQLLRGRGAGGVGVSTFHALGVRILREEYKAVGLKPGFSILDADDAGAVLAESAKEHDRTRLRRLAAQVSAFKNALLDPEAAAASATDEDQRSAARVYAAYQRSLRAYQAVDFDDLLGLPVQWLERDDAARARWQGRLRYLLIDEYQDTNRAQYRLMRLLAGPRAAFTAVGDDDQAIYAWRGADIENLRQLGRDYPQLRVIKLEQNYRSTTRILSAANALIAHNEKLYDKRLWSAHGAGEPLRVIACRDAEHEAETVVMKISAHKFEHRTGFGDYAILYRGNHQARAFEQQLRNHKIPYLLSGGQSFFERAEVKDLGAWLRLLANSDDDPAFIRAVTTPKRGIGSATLESLGRYAGHRQISLFAALFEAGAGAHLAAAQLATLNEFGAFINRMEWRAQREPADQVLEDLVRAIGYEPYLFEHFDTREAETKWRNAREFIDWLARKGEEDGKRLPELVQTIALASMLDQQDDRADAVQLATLHAAKGLEFKHVFLVGVEEGLLPHRESIDSGKIEEERRLMYVGVTRAQRTLTLTWCERRKQAGETRPCEPSRYIAELGMEARAAADAAPVDRARGSARLAALREMLARPEDS